MVVNRNSKIETPVRTGLLRNSYKTQIWDFKAVLTNFRYYGVFVNAYNPFMKRWIDKSSSDIKRIFVEEMRNFTESLTTK